MCLNETNFGFEKISSSEKKRLIHNIFSDIHSKYDFMNDIMSLGLHRTWKNSLVEEIKNFNSSILEVATGSGDVAFKILKKARKNNTITDLTVSDINADMLNLFQEKAVNKNILDGINFVLADAEKLPFKDKTFDYYIISFGIRNVSNIELALSEAYRVLKPTGKFICLEFSQINSLIIKKLYDFIFYNFIPEIGGIITNKKLPYKYLVDSIAAFPNQETFLNILKKIGFSLVKYKNLNHGIVSIHTGYKI